MEDLAYRRLLDAYYLRECHLPEDFAETARLIRMKHNIAEVESVLKEFFVLTANGWSHERCDEEILKMQDKQAKARASAEASVNARKAKANQPLNGGITNAERALNERSTDVQLPTPTPTPTPKPKKKEGASAFVLPDWIPLEAWKGYEEMRVKAKKPMTDRARVLVIAELGRLRESGNDVAAVLDRSTVKSWTDVYAIKTAPVDDDPYGLRTAI